MCSLAVCLARFPRYSLSDVSMDLGHGQRWHGSCESVVSENQEISSDEPVTLLKIAFFPPSFFPSILPFSSLPLNLYLQAPRIKV